MELMEIRDAHDDNRKNNKISLPINDFFFVCAHYAVAYFLCADIYAAGMFRRKTIGMFQEKLG